MAQLQYKQLNIDNVDSFNAFVKLPLHQELAATCDERTRGYWGVSIDMYQLLQKHGIQVEFSLSNTKIVSLQSHWFELLSPDIVVTVDTERTNANVRTAPRLWSLLRHCMPDRCVEISSGQARAIEVRALILSGFNRIISAEEQLLALCVSLATVVLHWQYTADCLSLRTVHAYWRLARRHTADHQTRQCDTAVVTSRTLTVLFPTITCISTLNVLSTSHFIVTLNVPHYTLLTTATQ